MESADNRRERLERLALTVLGDPGIGSTVYSCLTFSELNDVRLTCRPVRDAIAATPLCPPVLHDDAWARPVCGPAGLRRFYAAYPLARSVRLEKSWDQFGAVKVTDDDIVRHCVGVRQLHCTGLPDVSDAGIAHIAAGIEVLSLRYCPRTVGSALLALRSARAVIFHASGGQSVLDEQLANLAGCEHVVLEPCRRLTEAGIARLRSVNKLFLGSLTCSLSPATFANRPPLRRLRLSFSPSSRPVSLAPDLFAPVGDTLTDLSIVSYAGALVVSNNALLRPLTRLTTASLIGVTGLTDAGLSHLQSLTRLEIRAPSLTGSGLTSLVNLMYLTVESRDFDARNAAALRRLRSLAIFNCKSLQADALAGVQRACPDLVHIELGQLWTVPIAVPAEEDWGPNYIRDSSLALVSREWECGFGPLDRDVNVHRRGMPPCRSFMDSRTLASWW